MKIDTLGGGNETAPQEIFRADLSKLQPGDVLLTRDVHSTNVVDRATSRTIRMATGGEFSHALICTRAPTFIEAAGENVSNLSIQNCFAHNIENIRLLRHKTPDIAQKASESALMFLGTPYSVKRAIESVIPGATKNVVDGKGIFCSALVAAVYSSAQCPNFSKLDPMKVTPQALEEASCFSDVTKVVFRQVITPPNWPRMSALDGMRVSNPIRDQQGALLNEYFSEISPLCAQLASDFPNHIGKLPTSFFEVIEYLSQGLKRFEIDVPLAMRTIELIGRVHEIDDKAFKLLSDGRFESVLMQAIKLDDESAMRMIEESFKPDPDLDVDDLRGLAEATDNQIRDRSSFVNHRASYPSGICLTLDKWLEIQKKSIEPFLRRKQLLAEILERMC